MFKKILIKFILTAYFLFTSNHICYSKNNFSVKYEHKNVSEFYPYDSIIQEYTKIDKFYLSKTCITLYNVTSWIGNSAGDFRRIEIQNKNGVTVIFDNSEGWVKAYGPISKYLTNDYFLEINIGGTEPVLIFFGYTYQSQPGWLTIISLQGPKPEIIFNQEVSLIKIVKNGKSHKLIIDYDFWERGDDNGASTRLRASADAYKSCREIYIENNELKVVPCTRTLADDKREELEENKKTNQVK